MAVCPMHVVDTCRASVMGGERDMPKSQLVLLILGGLSSGGASGRLGRCLTIILSVERQSCAVSRNRALIKRALKPEHSLSRHRFALRHRRLVPRQPVS